MGVRFSGGLLFYSSVPQFYFDFFSYNILFSPPSVPQSYFEDISYYILFPFPFVLQETTSFCSLLFGFRRTQYIPRFGGVLQGSGDFTWMVSDCEELVGGYLQEMMGLVLRSVIVSFHLPTSY